MLSRLKKLLRFIGPGFITGAADDDPSGIATYTQTGAQFGFSQLWTAFFLIPFMTVVQEMCGRIGIVTGRGLAGIMRKHYARPLLFSAVGLLLITNILNIGADLGAMASAGQLLLGIPFAIWLIAITAVTILLEIFVSYPTYAKFLKFLTLSLFAYIIAAFVIHQDWRNIVLSTLIPSISLNKAYLLNIVAILGTTISPYLFFWQADEEVEEEVASHKLKALGIGKPQFSQKDIRKMDTDTIIGMIFSNIVMLFIIITAASTLHLNGTYHIETATQAAEVLRPLTGSLTYLLFTLGIIGTGLLAVPILAGSASYAVAEALKWNVGLSKRFNQAHGFYAVIALSTGIGLLVNLTSIKPFAMLYYTAIINGIAAPILLVFILLISNNPKIMGKHRNNTLTNILGFMITIVMAICALLLILSLFGII